jgi:hypothetical protein
LAHTQPTQHHTPRHKTHHPQKKLTKRYEAAVRVAQWNSGPHQRARNVGNILEKEKAIKEQLRAEGGGGALPA